MGLDFVERFFKLTLDNVYRFACSVLFIVALAAYAGNSTPLAQLGGVLDYLAIPSGWLASVGEWVAERVTVVGVVATLVLMVALAFAAASDWQSRSGSTALLSIVMLAEVGQGASMFNALIVGLAGLTLVTWLATLVARRSGWDRPEWTGSAWERVANIAMTLILAALYFLSPLGWLISQEPYNSRGSRANPLYVERIERTSPTGAVRLHNRSSVN
ncbi:hypothetical protein [Leifsonia shinshuensis]|uniref:Uncharacterized protein n=1 Tax=Leifsonia shinshuensis TaxID=150026 RepID=A0A7G6YAM5_9MICO|nr:hypothetical protein [Leifsonia shinshuensis]QNE35540.1 hypothetical protein F1C12_10640 [Leifsonia shinshuensis]